MVYFSVELNAAPSCIEDIKSDKSILKIAAFEWRSFSVKLDFA